MPSRVDISKENQKLIIERYSDRRSIDSVTKKTGFSNYLVKRVLVENNVHINKETSSGMCARKYRLDDDYFKDINSNEKAYILGFLWADGHNGLRKGPKGLIGHLVVQLNEDDREVLDYLSRCLYGDQEYRLQKISKEKERNSINGKRARDQYRFSITRVGICKDLLDLGMTPNKTRYSRLPLIGDKFMHSFMLGYFDGDGCICIRPSGKKMRGTVSYSSNKHILEDILQWMKSRGVNFKLEPSTSSKIAFRLSLNALGDVRNFYNIIYRDAPYFLKRKHDKFMQLLHSTK